MAFNINKLALEPTTELHLRNPATGEYLYDSKPDGSDDTTKPVLIVIYGATSKPYKQAIHALQNRRLKANKSKPVTAEMLEDESIDLLVKCSVKGINIEHNGAPLDNPEAFRSLYSSDELSWIRTQVDEVITDAASFLSEPAKD